MRSRLLVAVVLAAVTTAVAGCSHPAAPSTVSTVAITGTTFLTAVGQTGQFMATATRSNGTTLNVTTQATWQSSNTAVATISGAGLVTVHGFGTADIEAAYQGASGTLSILVMPPPSVAVIKPLLWVHLEGPGCEAGRGKPRGTAIA
jgi:hypothetical protein